MEVCTCRECRRLFNYLAGVQICPNCKDKLEKKFDEVKEYLAEYPQADMSQLIESCEVKRNIVTQWVREGRLELAGNPELQLHCDGCGSVIKEGLFCARCKSEFILRWREIDAEKHPLTTEKNTKNEGPHMRFIRH